MPLVEWKPELDVGVEEIDKDHQVLVELLNRMYEACEAEDQESAYGVLEELAAYTEWHFTREEALMTIHGYEFSERHRQEHQQFTDEVHEYINEALAGSLRPRAIASFMQEWLLKHIAGSDRHLGQSIAAARKRDTG